MPGIGNLTDRRPQLATYGRFREGQGPFRWEDSSRGRGGYGRIRWLIGSRRVFGLLHFGNYGRCVGGRRGIPSREERWWGQWGICETRGGRDTGVVRYSWNRNGQPQFEIHLIRASSILFMSNAFPLILRTIAWPSHFATTSRRSEKRANNGNRESQTVHSFSVSTYLSPDWLDSVESPLKDGSLFGFCLSMDLCLARRFLNHTWNAPFSFFALRPLL